MTEKQFRDYKDTYLEDFKNSLHDFLKDWTEEKNSAEDRKLNELIVDIFNNDYNRIKTLSYFPQYDSPYED